MENEAPRAPREARKVFATFKVLDIRMDTYTMKKVVSVMVTVPRENGRTEYAVELRGDRSFTLYENE